MLPGHTLLPGEHASFVFFEPRYRRLCELALHGQPPDGRFVHLATTRLKADVAERGLEINVLEACADVLGLRFVAMRRAGLAEVLVVGDCFRADPEET